MKRVTKVILVGLSTSYTCVQHSLELKTKNRTNMSAFNGSTMLSDMLYIKLLIPNPIKFN